MICLLQLVGENPTPNKSRFTLVELPGLEKLSDDPNQLRQREGPALSKALIALNQVVTSLSSNPFPDRVINYRYCVVKSFILNLLDVSKMDLSSCLFGMVHFKF
jgi:hypothetical protein